MKFFDLIFKVKMLLDNKDRISILILSFFTFIGLILEVIGIALIIPIISLTISEENKNEFLDINILEISNYFNFSDPLIFLLTLLLIVFFGKMIFFGILYFNQKTFVSNLITKISNTLFNLYSSQKLNYYTKKNRSVIIQNLQNETYYLFLFFESLTILLSELLLIFVFILFIYLYDPESLLILLIYFGLMFLAYTFLTRKKSVEWGNKRLELDSKISKLILETFGFIKQIIVNDSHKFFNEKFISLNKSKYKYFSYRLTLDQIPKVYFEFVTVVFIIFYTFFLNLSNDPTEIIITKLGVLIAISYKVMPGLSKISASYQTIKNTSSSLNTIIKEFKQSKLTDDAKNQLKTFNKSIDFKNLSFKYDSKTDPVIKNFNINIQKNQIVGIIGKSGKGKTTLIDIISGLYDNFSGELFVDSKMLDLNKHIWKPNVSYVSQDTFIFEDSLKNNITISKAGKKIDNKQFQRALKLSQIYNWTNSLESNVNTIISQDGTSISGGQKQRIGIARAIYKDSDILIFDEPTSSLDEKTEEEIMKTIYSLKGYKTIIIITHKVSSLEKCDKIFEIK
jgi:ATP-binding cassette, subfamily B, bacterial PglK